MLFWIQVSNSNRLKLNTVECLTVRHYFDDYGEFQKAYTLESESIEDVLNILEEATGETSFVVERKLPFGVPENEPGDWMVEIYNDYRE